MYLAWQLADDRLWLFSIVLSALTEQRRNRDSQRSVAAAIRADLAAMTVGGRACWGRWTGGCSGR